MTDEFNWASNLNSATNNIRKERNDKSVEEFCKYIDQALIDNPQLLDEIKEHANRRIGNIQKSTEQ